jgi:hypothetical protein
MVSNDGKRSEFKESRVAYEAQASETMDLGSICNQSLAAEPGRGLLQNPSPRIHLKDQLSPLRMNGRLQRSVAKH